jgi:hypothetical protein
MGALIGEARHFASHAPELVRPFGDLEAYRNVGLCEKVVGLQIKHRAKTSKTADELVRAANIASSLAPTAQPHRPSAGKLSRVATNPIKLSKRFKSFGAKREDENFWRMSPKFSLEFV